MSPLSLRRVALECLGHLGSATVGGAAASLDPDRLRRAAQRRAGLEDWGDPSVHRFLERSTEELRNNGNLTTFGRLALGSNLEHHLTNRLQLLASADLADTSRALPGGDPVFITGLYRSGTTLLHRLLASRPDLQSIPYWRLRRPVVASPRQAKSHRRSAVFELRTHRLIEPRFESAHPMRADEPEECLFLFENACAGTMPFVASEAHGFADWLLDQDLRPAYRFFRQQLEMLAVPGRRLVVKWPFHLWHLDALFDVFPTAQVILCDRDPAEAVPSSASLAALARAPMVRSSDRHHLGRFWLELSASGTRRARRTLARAAHRDQITIVPYEELVSAPHETAQRIATACGLDVPHEAAPESPRQTARHRYSAAAFGLDVEVVRTQVGRLH